MTSSSGTPTPEAPSNGTTETAPSRSALDFRRPTHRAFAHLLVNVLVVSVMNFTVWFAITFWVFLQTRSVLATGMVAGIFLVATSLTGIWFGSLVDHYRKKMIMQVTTLCSFVAYAVAFGIYQLTPKAQFTDASNVILWVFIVVCMLGVIAGNPRGIALPTMVTLLIEEDRRDKANGLVGSTMGVSFLVTSVISGLLVAAGDMFYVLLLALAAMLLAIAHLTRVRIDERPVVDEGAEPADAPPRGRNQVDLRGTIRLIQGVPGLFALIFFSCFNNFLGGAFMALLDAYGLSMMKVQAWGLLWGGLSVGVIVGGLLVAKTGLTSNPLRLLLLINLVLWSVTCLFPLQASIVLMTVGMAIYMLLMPYAEAAEQTILQRVVPYERQGRVFGFAQSIEMAASPLTAFLIGPLTQLVFIPFMTEGTGADLIGGWFGTGPARGIALVFVLTGILGLIVTILALLSKYYRQLSARYTEVTTKTAVSYVP